MTYWEAPQEWKERKGEGVTKDEREDAPTKGAEDQLIERKRNSQRTLYAICFAFHHVWSSRMRHACSLWVVFIYIKVN
jgi:hypothetical protein